MISFLLLALVSLTPVDDSGELLPSFIDHVLASESDAAVGLVSPGALATVDSMIAEDPSSITEVCAVFGLAPFVPEELTDARTLIGDILSAPPVPAMVMFANPVPGEPFSCSGRTFVPVVWGIPGMRDTLFIEAEQDDDLGWMILDFFTVDPRSVPGRGRRT